MKRNWPLWIVAGVGAFYGVEESVDVLARGLLFSGVAALPLACLLAPLLIRNRREWIFWLALTFLVFEIARSGRAITSGLFSSTAPNGLTVFWFGRKVLYLPDLSRQAVYLTLRACIFVVVAIFLLAGWSTALPQRPASNDD